MKYEVISKNQLKRLYYKFRLFPIRILKRNMPFSTVLGIRIDQHVFGRPRSGSWSLVRGRVSSKWKKKISVRTETNRNKICFAFVSVCFVKPKKNIFRLVSVFRTYNETTETNRTVSKRTETIQNFLKNIYIKNIIRFCWSLYCYFYNCTVQYITVTIFRNLSVRDSN